MIDDFAPRDQDEVRALILEGLGEHWGVVDHSLNPDLDDIATTYGDGRIIVVRDAEAAGAVIGTGTLVRRDDTTAEIVRMSVRSDRRRDGIGRCVVEALLATAATWRVERVILETSAEWTDVVRFYESCGFMVTHYDDGAFGRDTWFELRLS